MPAIYEPLPHPKYEHKEYPKLVAGVVVHSAEEEAALAPKVEHEKEED